MRDAGLADISPVVIVVAGGLDFGGEGPDVTRCLVDKGHSHPVGGHRLVANRGPQRRERAAERRSRPLGVRLRPEQTGQAVPGCRRLDSQIGQKGDCLSGVHLDGCTVSLDSGRPQQSDVDGFSSQTKIGLRYELGAGRVHGTQVLDRIVYVTRTDHSEVMAAPRPMRERARRLLIALAVLIATFGIIVGLYGGTLEEGDQYWVLAWVAWAPVGSIILWQRTGNGVGRAMLGIGLAWGLGFALLDLSARLTGSAAAWAELGNTLLGVVPWLAIVWLLLVYPSGGYTRKAEQVIGRSLIGFGVVVATAFAVDPTPMEETGLTSPIGIAAVEGVAHGISGDQSFLVLIVFVLAAIVSVVARWRSSVGVERLQYRWLLMGALVFLLTISAGQLIPEDSNAMFLWIVGGAAIPVTVGVAVLRFRLYEIDRIVSRTVSYTLVVVLLAAVYVGGVTGLTSLLPDQSRLVVAATTLLVAALFNPVRRRVQGWVDRRFNRSRYDTERVMDRFAGSLRDQVDSDEVVDGWVGVVSETMQPAAVGVWLRGKTAT